MDKNGAAGFHLRAGRREWVGLAVLALPTLLLALDASVLFLALPHLVQTWSQVALSCFGSPTSTAS
jgi:MFS transporter, DHA2 family, multidrug resistance protein